MSMKYLNVGFIVLLLSACAAAPEARQGPQAAIEKFRLAFNSKDAAAVAVLFSADGKLIPAGKPIISGTENIRNYWQAAFNAGVSHIEKTPIEISSSGDLAVETSTYIVLIKDNSIHGRDTLVWHREPNGMWKISTDIWNGEK